jgi:hypothetical protein
MALARVLIKGQARLWGEVTRERREAAMREDQKKREGGGANHVVFDFTGLERPNVGDLSLILTARLQSGPTGNVWVRALPWQTERILKLLRLDHMFRTYPTESDDLN